MTPKEDHSEYLEYKREIMKMDEQSVERQRNKEMNDTMNVKEYNMDDVYKITNNASVELEVDNDVLIIRIPYLKNDAQEIIDMLDGDESS